jgi:hypothetical protein
LETSTWKHGTKKTTLQSGALDRRVVVKTMTGAVTEDLKEESCENKQRKLK